MGRTSIQSYLLYGGITILLLIIFFVCFLYGERYKRRIKQMRLELYKESRAKESQYSISALSNASSVLNTSYNYSSNNGSTLQRNDTNDVNENGIVSYSRILNNNGKQQINYINEGEQDKHQSVHSNTTKPNVHFVTSSYSYNSLKNQTSDHQDSKQYHSSRHTNNNNPQNTTAVTNANIYNANAISNSNIINNVPNVKPNYSSKSRSNNNGALKAPEKLKINTINLKSENGYFINSSNSIKSYPNSAPVTRTNIPKYRILNYPSNNSSIQNQEESNYFTTKPLNSIMKPVTTMSLDRPSSYGHYDINNTIYDTQNAKNLSNKRSLSIIIEPPTNEDLNEQSNNNNDNSVRMKKDEKHQSYTGQLKPILTVNVNELKDSNSPQSARLASEKRKAIIMKNHYSYSDQLTPVLSDKNSSTFSFEKPYRHSFQSIHSAYSAHSIHNVVDEEIVSPNPISLVSSQRLSFLTSEIEEKLNKKNSQSSSSSNNEMNDEDEVVIIENDNEKDVPESENANNLNHIESLENKTEMNLKHASTMAEVSLPIDIDTLKIASAALNSQNKNKANNDTGNGTINRHNIHSLISDNGDAKLENNINAGNLSSSIIEDNIKNDTKRNSERSSRYYSKQRLSYISNYSEFSEHNNSAIGSSILNLLINKKSLSTASSSVLSERSNSPFLRIESPLTTKRNSTHLNPLSDNEFPSKLQSKERPKEEEVIIIEEEEKEEEKDEKETEKTDSILIINSSILDDDNESIVVDDNESIDDKKDSIHEETASSKKSISVSSSSLSKSIYLDVRKEASEQEVDNSSSNKKIANSNKNKQRMTISSEVSNKNGIHKENMKFEELFEPELNHLTKSFVLYDSDSVVTDRMSHESKKQSINSSSSNFNNFNYDCNTSFSSSQKNLRFMEGGKERMFERDKDKISDKENNNISYSLNSNVSGTMAKNSLFSFYSNQSNGGNSQYQNDNLNLRFINNSINTSINFNNDSIDTNDEEDDINISSFIMDLNEKIEKNLFVNDSKERLYIDRRALYSLNQPVKPPKSQRRQHINNLPLRLTPPTRDDDIYSNSSTSINFTELQKYKNDSMPLSLDNNISNYFHNLFNKSFNSTNSSQTIHNTSNQSIDHEDDTIKDSNDYREMNSSFSHKAPSIIARSTSEHSVRSAISHQSSNKRLKINNPHNNSLINTNEDSTINNNRKNIPLPIKTNLNETNLNENSLNLNENSLNLNETSLNLNEISLNLNEISLNLNETSLNLNEPSLNLNEPSLNLNEPSLNLNETSLNINESNLNETNLNEPNLNETNLNEPNLNETNMNLNEININGTESETSKGRTKKTTSGLWSATTIKSSTSILSYSSSNYSSDLKDNHASNETEKLPQRVKDSVPKTSQYSSQKQHRRSSSSHKKRRHYSYHPSSSYSSKNKEKKTDELEQHSFSFSYLNLSQDASRMNESKSQPILIDHNIFTQNTDISETNTASPSILKKLKDNNDNNNTNNANNTNIITNNNTTTNNNSIDNQNMNNYESHSSIEMSKDLLHDNPENLNGKTLNHSQQISSVEDENNLNKEQESGNLKITSSFSNVNNQPIIEEKDETKAPSLKSRFPYYQKFNANKSTVPLLRDIISDSILKLQSQKLHPIRGKVHILADRSSPNPSPVSPVVTSKFTQTNPNEPTPTFETEKEPIERVTEEENQDNNMNSMSGKGKEKEEIVEIENDNKDQEIKEKSKIIDDNKENDNNKPVPSFIFNYEMDNKKENEIESSTSKQNPFSQESDNSNISSTISTNSIQKLPIKMSEKRKHHHVLHNNTSPILKTRDLKKKIYVSGVTSPVYKNAIHLSPNVQRKASPHLFYNSTMFRNNYSLLSRIEENGNMEQNVISPTSSHSRMEQSIISPTSSHSHINLENNEGNNNLSMGSDSSHTTESTNNTEYKNVPNATDQSASIIYNKSSISSSSEDDFDDEEEIISVDINLVSQDDASTYNSPFLFPVITPPNYELLLKDPSYRL